MLTRRTFLQSTLIAAVDLGASRTLLRGDATKVPSTEISFDQLMGANRGAFMLLHFNGAEVIEQPLSILSRQGSHVTLGFSDRATPHFTLRIEERPLFLTLHLEQATGDFSGRDTSLIFRCSQSPPLEGICLDYMGRDDSSGRWLQLTWPYLWNPNPADPKGAFALLPSGLADSTRDEALAGIWAEGTLPHPDVAEPWTAAAVKRWVDAYHAKFAGLSETTLSAANPGELYQLTEWLAGTGCRRVYLHTDTWRGEYWPRTRSFVAVNPAVFPRGREDLKAYGDYLKQRGLQLRLHNVSAGVGMRDPEFTQPDAIDPRLATWVEGHLDQEVGRESTELSFRPNPGSGFPHARLATYWNLQRFRVGAEVVEVGDIADADGPIWRLRKVRRGYNGTEPSFHPAGAEVAGLLCAYGQNYVPDTASSLLTEQAARYAALINEAGLDHQHYDGAEIHSHLEPWGFAKLSYHVAAKVNRPTTSSLSGGRPSKWNFELNFSRIRQLRELGYWAAAIPVQLAGHRNSSSWLDANYEIASRLLRPARRLGFSKPEPMFGITVAALEGHGLMPRFVELFRDWRKVIGTIGARETAWLREHLKPVRSQLRQRGHHEESLDVPVLMKDESGYSLVPTRVLGREGIDGPWITGQEFGPTGPRQYLVAGESLVLHNPYPAQPPQLILHVLPALERHRGDSLATPAPESTDATLADYQTGTIKQANAIGEVPPVGGADLDETLWPAAEAVLPAGDTRLSLATGQIDLVADNPTSKGIWTEQGLPSWACAVPLRGRRALAIEVVGDGSGAVLVCQLHGAGTRDYVVKLDFHGLRRIIVPTGEAAWSAACWGWRFDAKRFDYDAKVTRTSLGFGYVPPRCTARASVRCLEMLENVQTSLRNPVLHAGHGVLRVTGDVFSGEYLTFSTAEGARVYDENWKYLRILDSRVEKWNAPQGRVEVLVENAPGPSQPWLELQLITRGEPFPLTTIQAAIFNVKSFGAVGDGVQVETAALQRTIDACHENAGGTVLVPAGVYVTGTLKLRSNMTLRLEQGAVLLGSLNLADYATDVKGAVEAPVFNRCLLYAEDAKNIVFEGAGTIDGRGSRAAFPVKAGDRLAERPMLMRLVNCESVTFTDLTFRNPASWGIHLVECRQVRFDGVEIQSRDNNSNNDGIDLDGCSDVTIENCRINSGDDAICPKSTTLKPCENIIVRNCVISSHTAGFKLGTSSRGGFLNIKVTDTIFRDCPMGAIKLLLVDGGRMEKVELSRLTMENVGGPIFIRLGNRGRRYDRPTEQVYNADAQSEGLPTGMIRGVTIRRLKAEVRGDDLDRQGIMITGIPGHRIENIVLEDIQIRFAGKPMETPVIREVPEDIARYPEQFFFGLLPAWGLFVRHVDGLTLNHSRIDRTRPDVRVPFMLQDVLNLQAMDFRVNGKAVNLQADLESHE